MHDVQKATNAAGKLILIVIGVIGGWLLLTIVLLSDYTRWGARSQLRTLKAEPVATLTASDQRFVFEVEEHAKTGLMLDAGSGSTSLIRYIEVKDAVRALRIFHGQALSSGWRLAGQECSGGGAIRTAYDKRFGSFDGRLILDREIGVGGELRVELISKEGADSSTWFGPEEIDPTCSPNGP